MANKKYNLDLDLGFKTIEIKFPDVDDVVQIQFNPADVGLSERMLNAQAMIEEEVSKTDEDDAELDEDARNLKMIETLASVNKRLCEIIDYAFGNKISDGVFKHCAPLALVNGNYFIFTFFEKIAPVIRKIQQEEMTAADKKADKYLKKYADKNIAFAKKIGGIK